MALDDALFRQVVVDALRIAPGVYRQDLKLGDIDQWDSIAHLDLVAAIESAFGIQFTADEMLELTSIDQLRNRIVTGR